MARQSLKLMTNKAAGFTLIEVLMVIFVLGIIIIMGGELFFSVIKGGSKTEVTKEVKQNGDYAIGVMSRMIRNSRGLTVNSDGQTCEASMNKIKLLTQDNDAVEFGCFSDLAAQVAKVASGSSYLTNSSVTLNQSGGTCPGSLNFSCRKGNEIKPPEVTISFTLYQKGNSNRPEEQAQISFKTTVSLRTY